MKTGLDDYLLNHSIEEFQKLKRLPLKHPTLKQHREWWKTWKKAKEKQKARPAHEQTTYKLLSSVALIEVHAAQQEVTSSPYSSDFLELALAVVVSQRIAERDGAPLWLLGVGAPSSDKTQTALGLSRMPEVYFLDTLTENSFITGYLDPSGEEPKDLLAELKGKALLIKDLTTLFSLKEDIVKRILGDLQSVYDGFFSRFTGTRGNVRYEVSFPILGCITPIVLSTHHRYMSMIGGRFLMYRVLPLNEKEREEGFNVIWNSKDRPKKLNAFKDLFSSFGHNLLKSQLPLIQETEEQIREINNMAELLARGRAVIRTAKREFISEESGKPVTYYEVEEIQIEEPWRAVLQLRTLGRSLAWIHGRERITDHEMELVRRVVLSTMPVDRSEVLGLFQNSEHLTSEDALTRKLCSEGIGKSYGRANQLLTELVHLKVLGYENNPPEGYQYRPVDGFDQIIRKPIESLDHIADLVTEEAQKAEQGPVETDSDPLTQNSPEG